MLDEHLHHLDAALAIGRVSAVEGRRVRVAVDKLKNGSHTLHRGALLRNAAVGGYVKIAKGYTSLVGKVDGEYIHEDRLAQAAYGRLSDRVARTLEVSLVGYLEKGEFRRGVRELPLLDNECYVLTQDELRRVHQFARVGVPTVRIGVLASEPTQSVDLGVDDIFASHIGIFGNTGSGKSYTLAKLYHELLTANSTNEKFLDRARIVVVDFNGEYLDRKACDSDASTSVIAPPDMKQEYRLSTRDMTGHRLPMPEAALQDPAIWQVLLEATEKTQAPFIKRVLRSSRWQNLQPNTRSVLEHATKVILAATMTSNLGVDRMTATQLLWDIHRVLGSAVSALLHVIGRFERCLRFHPNTNQTYYWQDAAQSAIYANRADWSSLISREVMAAVPVSAPVDRVDLLGLKMILQYYDETASGFANPEHLGPLLKRLQTRLPDLKRLVEVGDEVLLARPLTIVSLRDVKLEMRKVIPMLLCKHLYDEKKQSVDATQGYLNLVVDEAHNILSTQSVRESESWRDYRLETFEEIVKEGRKFGVFLTLASQRPHDISETIISQLHHYFLHRLVNNLDVRAVERAVAYLDAVSFESIPILPTGSCVFAGVKAQIPVILQVGSLPPSAEPNSRTMSVVSAWS